MLSWERGAVETHGLIDDRVSLFAILSAFAVRGYEKGHCRERLCPRLIRFPQITFFMFQATRSDHTRGIHNTRLEFHLL